MTGTAIDEATPVMGRFIWVGETIGYGFRAAYGRDAERLARHDHAERGNDQDDQDDRDDRDDQILELRKYRRLDWPLPG